MALNLDEIRTLFDQHGALSYNGESVSQLDHALQSAALAEQEDAGAELVAAALLHDLGHLLRRHGPTPSARGIDDLHQYCVLPFLRAHFSAAVLEPIRLHVDAKRCLCAIEPEYFATLSPDSVRSLALQGGPFTAAAASEFMAQPYAQDAMRLRRWDDRAKTAGVVTPPLDHYLKVVEQVLH